MRRLALVLLVLSCRKERPTTTHDAAPTPIATVQDVSPSPTLAERLRPHVVTDRDYARRVLYTWTTAKQIAELRTSARLLVATAYEGSGPSRFVLDLEDLMRSDRRGHELAAKVLLAPTLARRRYAWPSPFATRMGLSGRGYGDALVRVVLKEDALFLRFDPDAREPFEARDAKGGSVALALLPMERIGAVFHVRTARTATAPFREFVLCNESQIAEWSFGTDAIRRELDDEAALLRDLAHAGRLDDAATAKSWAELPPDAPLGAIWRAAIAFDNERYAGTPDGLEAIARALAAYDPTPPPLVHAAM